jgi:hydroxymethylpyrimidine pyrophosphatase-like HAD family hydrolase
MLRYADVAAVPGNASPRLRPAADIVIPTAAEHGISALADYMLSPAFPPRGKKGDPLTL